MVIYQVPKLQIVEGLYISLLSLFLIPVQLVPEVIDTTHIQNLVCIDLPCVAAENTENLLYSVDNLIMDISLVEVTIRLFV